ncbi:unnamed protein product [Laminaria digitata]
MHLHLLNQRHVQHPYLDDLLLLGGNTPVLKELKRKLMERFTMTDMGDVSLVLGIHIARNREAGTLTTSQEDNTNSILARFGMARYNPVHPTGVG